MSTRKHDASALTGGAGEAVTCTSDCRGASDARKAALSALREPVAASLTCAPAAPGSRIVAMSPSPRKEYAAGSDCAQGQSAGEVWPRG